MVAVMVATVVDGVQFWGSGRGGSRDRGALCFRSSTFSRDDLQGKFLLCKTTKQCDSVGEMDEISVRDGV